MTGEQLLLMTLLMGLQIDMFLARRFAFRQNRETELEMTALVETVRRRPLNCGIFYSWPGFCGNVR